MAIVRQRAGDKKPTLRDLGLENAPAEARPTWEEVVERAESESAEITTEPNHFGDPNPYLETKLGWDAYISKCWTGRWYDDPPEPESELDRAAREKETAERVEKVLTVDVRQLNDYLRKLADEPPRPDYTKLPKIWKP